GIIFFFHPLVRFALRQLSVERELACDERVISLGASPALYAESLLKAARRLFSPPFASASVSFASRKTLQKRIDNIMNSTISKKSRLFFALPASAIILVMLLLGCTQASRTSREEQEIRAFLNNAAE